MRAIDCPVCAPYGDQSKTWAVALPDREVGMQMLINAGPARWPIRRVH